MSSAPTTRHVVHFRPATALADLPEEGTALVVTSPPYPMIEMWDNSFGDQDERIGDALRQEQGEAAFALMHQLLDRVWGEVARVLAPGGIACVNIGDAARSIGSGFRLFPNHARVIDAFLRLGLHNLPNIIWRKPTNAPNKFMGSGMLPPGAYVTLEHEYILIFRKGDKRVFRSPDEQRRRAESAIFWEERNRWYSDVWSDLTGAPQKLASAARSRSGAFPFELAWRLVNMFSIKGDVVLDPFVGTGTTLLAAAANERHSIGYEIEFGLRPALLRQLGETPGVSRQVLRERIERHLALVGRRTAEGKPPTFTVSRHGWPCVSRQETGMVLRPAASVRQFSEETTALSVQWEVSYGEIGPGEQVEMPLA
ncbi:MAG TPA: site-specific DNA-methyltransferase [candidate division Zixibacteria bacterium]|nr:site-specific DNA-methyltransferase [candidate division Zixibacteria bacterium]MDD4917895.1 site-specific DNA-methyltransferase [candidate division Zixibacteria bacterium]MDM7973493.1 site-specific DNA-methyltransferase [candidate division Zixibacteria bacterium]HPM38133.1 site-specific DNA-methyltransferase [candidate division Zixibacteria bacterium]